jgi:O-methyltransferase
MGGILREVNRFLELFGVRFIYTPRRTLGKVSTTGDQVKTLKHHVIEPYATYSPWDEDLKFRQIYQVTSKNSLVDIYRSYELWLIGQKLGKIPGIVLEVGVWQGGSGALLAKAVEGHSREVYLADTFKGVVKTGANDPRYKGGEHSDTSENRVSQLLKKLNINHVKILKGVFPEETGHMIDGKKIALLHSDVDAYQSTLDILRWALPRMSPGGVIVFDDYGFMGTEGVTRCVNEFVHTHDLKFFYNLNGHGIIVVNP